MNNKINKINHAFVREISNVLEFEVKNQHIKFVTITAVKVTNDLSYAKVYFTTIDDREKVLKDLNNASGFFSFLRPFYTAVILSIMVSTIKTPIVKIIKFVILSPPLHRCAGPLWTLINQI